MSIALAAIGERDQADELLRYQAKLGGTAQYAALLRLASSLNLPATQLWLAHNGPAGTQPDSFARFPAPDWRPDGGWRVDPSLIYAHTLQESGFRTNVVSSAGARGLMQVRPGTGGDMGLSSADQLFVPSTNMEFGQRYLESLRDMSATGGLLPKVMAAYNAGPEAVARRLRGVQRLLGGALDDRAVHQRVGVGQADLDDVDAARDHRPHRLDRALDGRVADRQVADQRGRRAAQHQPEHEADQHAQDVGQHDRGEVGEAHVPHGGCAGQRRAQQVAHGSHGGGHEQYASDR